jgi:tRNA nucleotidyltransferase/poly(A) polymerase
MKLEPSILHLLTKFQQKSPSFIVGGYLRDLIAGITPNDIDIATEMSIEEVKKTFPQLSGTEKGLAFGVGRFNYNHWTIEISTYEPNGFHPSVPVRDFVINSLFHDGQTLHDEHGAINDIKAKIIRPLDSPAHHFNEKPEAFLRALRLSSHLGFSLSDDLVIFMLQNKELFHQSTINRLQMEGYKIIQGAHPLKALHYLKELRFLSIPVDFDENMTVPHLTEHLHIRFAYLASVIGIEAVYDFIDLFQLSKRMKEKIHYLSPYFDDTKKVENPYIINEVILLKRYQYHQNPEKLKAYLMNLRK